VDDGLRSRPSCDFDIRYLEGKRPFCFSRNVNLGLSAVESDGDVLLVNDDAYFLTPEAIEALSAVAHCNDRVGIVSPVFSGGVKNARQRIGNIDPSVECSLEPRGTVGFVAVYLRRDVIQQVGFFDERFTGYGYEDDDYCLRARECSFQIAIAPKAAMFHGSDGAAGSCTFRQVPRFPALVAFNRSQFLRKWIGRTLCVPEADCLRMEQILSDVFPGW
jgi:GT2 family glycosyltransferase